jgi:2'-5' RNA ligase
MAEMRALHDALEAPLLELGCYRREERAYTPHLTLGRVKGQAAAEPLAAAVKQFERWQGGQTQVREVQVLSSELRPDGPEYMVLSRAPLRGK